MCRHLEQKFRQWMNGWQRNNVTDTMLEAFEDWLCGRVEGLQSTLMTVQEHLDDPDLPPYHPYTKYHVQPMSTD